MASRRRFLLTATAGLLVVGPSRARAQEGVFMTPEDAARQLFPGEPDIIDRTIAATPALRQRIREVLGRSPSLWENVYRVFTIRRGDGAAGFVVVVEEIGKHRPITYAVAIERDGRVHDVAVLAYREAYGGEVKERRFLRQYVGKRLDAPLQPYRDIRNISGATLSVEATGRAVRKAIAVLTATGDLA
jgi:FMN-binding protein